VAALRRFPVIALRVFWQGFALGPGPIIAARRIYRSLARQAAAIARRLDGSLFMRPPRILALGRARSPPVIIAAHAPCDFRRRRVQGLGLLMFRSWCRWACLAVSILESAQASESRRLFFPKLKDEGQRHFERPPFKDTSSPMEADGEGECLLLPVRPE